MKNILLIAGAMLLSVQMAFAQKTVTKSFSGGGKQKIVILISKSDLEITGSGGNEVNITTAQELAPPPDRAKGLKPLYNKASDNTGIGLDIQEAGGVITIKKATSQAISYKMKVPSGADINIEDAEWSGGNIKIKDISGEIELKSNNVSYELDNVTGPVVSSGINGALEIKFGKINAGKPSHISTINGHVDITLPADTKANLEISSIIGEVYTDFDIKQDSKEDDRSKGLTAVSGGNISGTINGGGVEISLSSINSNIYIRKK